MWETVNYRLNSDRLYIAEEKNNELEDIDIFNNSKIRQIKNNLKKLTEHLYAEGHLQVA